MLGVLMVAIGGALGSACRYGIALLLKGAGFWAGTLAVNLVGSFILGLLFARGLPEDPQTRLVYLGLTTGAMGGFTTFSTFSVDALRLIERGGAVPVALYVGISAAGGIALAWAGHALGKAL